MSLQTLELENFHLTLASEKLKLDIASTADIRFQSGWIPSQDQDGIVKALTSGQIWVSRGRRCRLDIEVSFNGKPLDRTSRVAISESLGYSLRDAQLWSQLSLTTNLEILHSSQAAESATDISIYINHGTSIAKTQPKAWLLDNIDIRAPESMLCAEFERLQIQMSFYLIHKGSRMTPKRLKSCPPESDSAEPMLLDYISGVEDEARLTFFEDVVAVLRGGLSNSITKCFDGLKTKGSRDSPKLLDEVLFPLDKAIALPRGPSVSPESVVLNSNLAGKQGGRRFRFPSETREKLKRWVNAHPGNLHPTKKEKLELMKQTGLQNRQLSNWFSNTRMRPPKNLSKASLKTIERTAQHTDTSPPPEVPDDNDEDPLIISYSDDEMLFGGPFEDPEGDEMLPSQTTSTIPSLTSQFSTISTASSSIALKHLAVDEIIESNKPSALTTLPTKPANKLTSVALYILIAGPSSRKRDLQGIQICKRPPSMLLSLLVPSIFCPGFKEIMAHNSKFLSTISNAVSPSWVRNVQGAGLRKKLVALSNAKVSEYNDGDGEEGSVERLAAVVQGRIWRMMQRKLYDEGTVRSIWRKDGAAVTGNTNSNEDTGEDEDLLCEVGDRQSIDTQERNFEDYIGEELMDDDEDLFDNLFNGKEDNRSDGGLLGYLEEQERLAVEAETDEMLFGTGYCDDIHDDDGDDELLLLRDSSQEEMMLL